jgi:hypothetical protein
MRADGSFEELPVRPSHDPDSEGLLTKKEKEVIDGVAPDVRFSKGEHLWNNNERRMQFEQVAEGSVTLDEFVAQLSDRVRCLHNSMAMCNTSCMHLESRDCL